MERRPADGMSLIFMYRYFVSLIEMLNLTYWRRYVEYSSLFINEK